MIDLPVAVRARTAPVATPVATNSNKKPKTTSAKGAKRQRVSKATTNTATDDGVAAAVVPTDTQAKQSDVPISEVSLGTALMMFCEEACWQLKAVGMSLPTVMGDTEFCGAVDTMLCNFMKVLVGKGATIMVARKTEHERLQGIVLSQALNHHLFRQLHQLMRMRQSQKKQQVMHSHSSMIQMAS